MKPYIYAIGDVHGEYDLFQKLVAHYDPSIHQLVLLGDLNDRGPRTKECFLLGMKLVKETNAVYLRGNHEEYFYNFSKHRKIGTLPTYVMGAKKRLKVCCTQELQKNIPQPRLP